MAACTVKHRNDETRSRCHSPECRAAASARGATTPRTDRPRPPAPPEARNVAVVPDANGDPIKVDLDAPVIKRRTLTPSSVASLPSGTRYDQCTFRPGDYHVADASVIRCKVPAGARLAISGQGAVSDTTAHGDVYLGGETFSSANAYHGRVFLADEVQSSHDHFARGYEIVPGGRPTVDNSTTTFGAEARVSGSDAQEALAQTPQEPTRRPTGVAGTLARRAGRQLAYVAVVSLLRRGRRR